MSDKFLKREFKIGDAVLFLKLYDVACSFLYMEGRLSGAEFREHVSNIFDSNDPTMLGILVNKYENEVRPMLRELKHDIFVILDRNTEEVISYNLMPVTEKVMNCVKLPYTIPYFIRNHGSRIVIKSPYVLMLHGIDDHAIFVDINDECLELMEFIKLHMYRLELTFVYTKLYENLPYFNMERKQISELEVCMDYLLNYPVAIVDLAPILKHLERCLIYIQEHGHNMFITYDEESGKRVHDILRKDTPIGEGIIAVYEIPEELKQIANMA